MELITDEDYINTAPNYYFPRHAVLKADSLRTKVRVVFDGSAKSTNGLSLNNNLEVGLVIQDDLCNILLRFRAKRYVLSADITKMYRQVLVNPKQTRLQRILWRNNVNKSIETYELKTLTYGTASAAYLSIKCLRKTTLIFIN